MKLYIFGFWMLAQRFILRRNTGEVVRQFATRMGVVYVKMAQILAMQNYGNIFTEEDRQRLAKICDHCPPMDFAKIRAQLEAEYARPLEEIFREIDPEPVGAASISQVHRAVLLDGREVAVKVKRQDVTRRVQRDVRQIQRFIRRFGRLAYFRNFLGSDKALNLWAEWIRQETDFHNEQQNLLHYRDFVASVNGKVPGTADLVVPELYDEYCTANVIVMEFITAPTINQLALTPENKARLRQGLNDYVSLSFYALLHGMPLTFHGDPHGGNIYLTEKGSIGFLDLGLMFSFTSEEADFVRQLFLNAYNARTDKLIELLLADSSFTSFDRAEYRATIEDEVRRFRGMPVTQFFVEMIGIYTHYNISPPTILFKMAKAFVALFGINTFIENSIDTEALLMSQVVEYYLERAKTDAEDLVRSGLRILPNFLAASLEHGAIHGFATQVQALNGLHRQFTDTLDHCQEVLAFIRPEV